MTDLQRLIIALHKDGVIADSELRKAVIAALSLFKDTRHLFAIEKELHEICEYERAKP